MPRKTKKAYEYIDIIRSQMNDICEKIRNPRVVDYQNEIATYINTTYGEKITGRDIHTTIARNLKKLYDDGEMILLEKKYYVPTNDENKKTEAKNDIIDNVIFTNREVLKASNNIYVVCIEKEQLHKDADNIKKMFLKMIGADRCFTISVLDNALIIFIYGFYDEDQTTKNEFESRLSEAVEKAWDLRHPEEKEKPKIKLKMKTETTQIP